MTQAGIQVNKSTKKNSSTEALVDILVFLIPFSWFIQFKIVGVLSGSDILCILTFVYLATRLQFRIESRAGWCLIFLCGLWLASQCLTDFLRGTPFRDYIREWSMIGMTIVYICVLWTLLYGRPRRITIFGWGLVLGTFLTYYVNPNEYMELDAWKFAFSFVTTWAVLLVATRKECVGTPAIVLTAGVGAVNILLGSRSTGGDCLAAALLLTIMRLMRKRSAKGFVLSTRTKVVMASSILLGLAGVAWAYQYAAGSGLLGDDAREKFETQSSGRLGLLLGGRVELLGSLPAIYDSPILGHGSFARDPTYLLAAREAFNLLDYTDEGQFSKSELAEGLIPTHSYIFGAWVWAGLLGAVFWLFVLGLIVRCLLQVYPASVSLLPFAAYAAFTSMWDIFFSPYGAAERMTVTFYIVMLMTCLAMARSSVKGVADPNKATGKSPSLHGTGFDPVRALPSN